ncbi:hypothetical protein LOC71_11460 [Rhodopirellula sp. JC740]|uniref:Transmembrane protein n=1 Tax=Rhodopirellula halodulae TaxID=2894198 RepID=A0ABS8NH81_9BACT|nr:DUF6653 family protein [Rhodopirellula sp. JC740]MCC9642895.1 hypothetical protein [Rhodopirellula sp. JC740]
MNDSHTNALGRATEQAMGMSQATWERHANPWSGWTRVAIFPLLTLAIWSRVWIGWWSVTCVAIVAIWIWLNPRVFPPPQSVDNWMSRGVLGEQIWLRQRDALASHHRHVIRSTITIASVGALVWLIGVTTLNLTATLTGMVASMLGKLWFIDRMVWLQREAEASEPSSN